MFQDCGIEILGNLDSFPIDLDKSLHEYHEKIAGQIVAARALPDELGSRDRYYVNRVRPFFTGGQIYYEVTFSNISDRVNKFDRMIAFTDIDLTDWYAAELTLLARSIEVFDQAMPVTIIRAWEISIRPCEFNNFAKIFDRTTKVNRTTDEYRSLMRYLTQTGANLLDIMDMEDARYLALRESVTSGVASLQIFPTLDDARGLISARKSGYNILRYLMLRLNNRIIRLQFDREPCGYLSNLRLSRKCIPFERMPLCTFPKGHTPRFSDVVASMDGSDRAHEVVARRIQNNVETRGVLYTPDDELGDHGGLDQLVARFNGKLHHTHAARKLLRDKGYVFIQGYEDDTVSIIEKLQEHTKSHVEGYSAAVTRWLDESQYVIDDKGKEVALKSLFAQSRIALIYGAAGTGKSTMVNHIANYFGSKSKLLLAQTNPAKANLERRVSAQNTEVRTIASHLARSGAVAEFDVLVIDECSIVSNADLLNVLESTSFQLLVLVGDVYQIESIRFGNWFGLIRSFVPKKAVYELDTPYRTTDESLLRFWERVRSLDDGIEEAMARGGYSSVLDQSLFVPSAADEIILCLNYDGLYGINNVNSFLQSSNPGEPVTWAAATYKVGDPVLFNDSEKYRPLFYNNLKGRIVGMDVRPERIQFDVSLDRPVDELDVTGLNIDYLGESIVRFEVYHRGNSDEDDDEFLNSTMPFQVAYAVSIHKAQGLEYESVKVVITDANEADVSHNIFYTAITRARRYLRIYWTPETQRTVVGSLAHPGNARDAKLLVVRRGLTV